MATKNPTLLQKKAVKLIVEERRSSKPSRKTMGEMLKEAGYSKNTAIKPSQVTESEGFKSELAKYGLTEGFIVEALVDDIEAKPRKRYLELNLGAEILGMKKRTLINDEDKPQELHLHLHKHENLIKVVSEAEEKIRQQIEEEI